MPAPRASARRATSRPCWNVIIVAVVPGYVGRSPEGEPTTLGRGGSDLSATVLGRALGSPEVWIMSDVDGVLDADPRLVPGASLMPRLSYREAGVFAGLGAKVLHPRTMEPAEEAGIEVFVRNTFAPEGPGTHVTGFEPGAGVRCVALGQNVAMEIPCTDGREGRAAMIGASVRLPRRPGARPALFARGGDRRSTSGRRRRARVHRGRRRGPEALRVCTAACSRPQEDTRR